MNSYNENQKDESSKTGHSNFKKIIAVLLLVFMMVFIYMMLMDKKDSPVIPITSSSYTISALVSNSGTITNVPFGTSKTSFLAALTKGQADQSWNTSDLSDPIVSGDTLVVTAQDGSTIATYTVTVNAELSHIASITSSSYTIGALVSNTGTITNIPFGTSKTSFLAALTKGQADQSWNTSDLSDPVVSGDTLVVTAQDGSTIATYTVTVNAELSHNARITSSTRYLLYYVEFDYIGKTTYGSIDFYEGETSADLISSIEKAQADQTWDTSNLSAILVNTDTLVVTAQDGVTKTIYTLIFINQ